MYRAFFFCIALLFTSFTQAAYVDIINEDHITVYIDENGQQWVISHINTETICIVDSSDIEQCGEGYLLEVTDFTIISGAEYRVTVSIGPGSKSFHKTAVNISDRPARTRAQIEKHHAELQQKTADIGAVAREQAAATEEAIKNESPNTNINKLKSDILGVEVDQRLDFEVPSFNY